MASAIAPLAVGFLANKVVSQVTGDSKLGAIAGLAAGGLTGVGGLAGGGSGILGASQAAPAFGGTAATAAGANASGNALTNFIGRQFPLSDFGASAAGSAIKSSIAPNLSSAMTAPFGGFGSPHAGMAAATPMNPAEFMGLGGPQVPGMQGFNTNMNAALPYGSPNPQSGIPVQPGLTAGNVMPADMFQTGFGEAGRGGFTGAQNQATNPYVFQDSTPSSMFDYGVDPMRIFNPDAGAAMSTGQMANPGMGFESGIPSMPTPQAAAPAPVQQWNPADYAPDDLQIYQSETLGSDFQGREMTTPKMDQRYNLNPNVRKPDVERLSLPNNEVPQTYDEFPNLDDASADMTLNDRSVASLDYDPNSVIGVGTDVSGGSSASTYSPTPDYNPAAVESQVMGPSASPAPVQAASAPSTGVYSPSAVDAQVMGPSVEIPADAASNIQRSYNMFGDDVSAGAAADTTLLAQSSEAAQAVASQLSDQDNIQNSVKAFGKKALDWLKANPDMIKFLGAAALSLLAKKKEEEAGGGGGGGSYGPMASAYAGTGGGGGGQAPLGFGLAQRKGYTPQAI